MVKRQDNTPGDAVARARRSASQEQHLALIEKGQQIAGHQPSAEALDRAARVLSGETSADEARAELEAKYGGYRTP